MEDLCIRKYRGYKVYLHNLSGFDGNFLFEPLTHLGNCKIIRKDNKIINFTFIKNINKTLYTLYFRDSFLLLNSSLKELSKAFNTSISKDFFPVKFNNINHVGAIPSIDYFNDITYKEYLEYQKGFTEHGWSFKEEAIKYCEKDCISLYQILTKFNELVFKEFRINMHNYSTIASLSYAKFRTNSLKKGVLPVIEGKVYEDLRQGYIRGHVDMYIPINEINTKVIVLDVISQYPFVMQNYPMPIGDPTYFKGDILKYEPDAYGFFYCEVTTPKYLKHPIILVHHKTKDGIITIVPLGNFKCMLYSEEMRNALKYGYKFKVLYGYLFKKGYIFNEFITKLYEFRNVYTKDNPLNLINKLFMNSLYGRFGMQEYLPESILVDQIDLESKLAE